MAGNMGQSLGAALGQFAFGGDNRKSQMKGMLDGAHAGAYDANRQSSLASALKAQAEAEQTRMQNESRRPDAMLRNAMMNFGIPQDDSQAVEGFLKTGKLGGGYDVSIDGMGPAMPPPSWAGKLPDLGRALSGVNNALTVGDKSVENIAKAEAINRGERMKDDVLAGRLDATKLAQSEYAGKGSAPFNFNEYGTGNNLTGKLDESTGSAVNFANKRRAETLKNSTETTNLRNEDLRQKIATKAESVDLTKASQLASFDTMLGTLYRLGQHPGLARSVGLVGMLPTIPGSDSANFQAELNSFQSQAFIPMVAQLKGMGALSDAEGKKLTAAVGALDPKMGEQAFRDSVARITSDMQDARGRMAGGSAPSAPGRSGATGSWGEGQTKAPIQIKNAADYANVPSGATYLDPNGQTRMKK